MQLANELRLTIDGVIDLACQAAPQRSAARERTATWASRSHRATPSRPSTKCSSRTNCDDPFLHRQVEEDAGPSTKCSSRTNCDVDGGVAGDAEEGALNEVQLANELRRRRPGKPLPRGRYPSTKCSSRTNCDAADGSTLFRQPLDAPSTKCSSRTNCDPRLRWARAPAMVPHPQRSAARERTATIGLGFSALGGWLTPQRSAARERTATHPCAPGMPLTSITLNEVQLANELRRWHRL